MITELTKVNVVLPHTLVSFFFHEGERVCGGVEFKLAVDFTVFPLLLRFLLFPTEWQSNIPGCEASTPLTAMVLPCPCERKWRRQMACMQRKEKQFILRAKIWQHVLSCEQKKKPAAWFAVAAKMKATQETTLSVLGRAKNTSCNWMLVRQTIGDRTWTSFFHARKGKEKN